MSTTDALVFVRTVSKAFQMSVDHVYAHVYMQQGVPRSSQKVGGYATGGHVGTEASGAYTDAGCTACGSWINGGPDRSGQSH